MAVVKVLMALVDDESGAIEKESAKNDEWVKISIKKLHALPDMGDNDDIKSFLDYLSDQLTKDSSSSGHKDLVFVKSSSKDINVSKVGIERPWLSEAEGFSLPNHDSGRIRPTESQVNVTDSSVTNYDSAEESTSVCSTPSLHWRSLMGINLWREEYEVSWPKGGRSRSSPCIMVVDFSSSGVRSDVPIGFEGKKIDVSLALYRELKKFLLRTVYLPSK
nr:hypothetical protein [Tanacetum cinerariifolium]